MRMRMEANLFVFLTRRETKCCVFYFSASSFLNHKCFATQYTVHNILLPEKNRTETLYCRDKVKFSMCFFYRIKSIQNITKIPPYPCGDNCCVMCTPNFSGQNVYIIFVKLNFGYFSFRSFLDNQKFWT